MQGTIECASKQMEEGLLKMCRLFRVACVCVDVRVCVCAGNQSVLDLCLFLKSTCELWTRRALSFPDFVVSSQRGGDSSASRVLSSPAFIHWMSHSFHSVITTPRSHLLCSDTVAKATTYDHFLFWDFIYQRLALSRHQSAAIIC